MNPAVGIISGAEGINFGHELEDDIIFEKVLSRSSLLWKASQDLAYKGLQQISVPAFQTHLTRLESVFGD